MRFLLFILMYFIINFTYWQEIKPLYISFNKLLESGINEIKYSYDEMFYKYELNYKDTSAFISNSDSEVSNLLERQNISHKGNNDKFGGSVYTYSANKNQVIINGYSQYYADTTFHWIHEKDELIEFYNDGRYKAKTNLYTGEKDYFLYDTEMNWLGYMKLTNFQAKAFYKYGDINDDSLEKTYFTDLDFIELNDSAVLINKIPIMKFIKTNFSGSFKSYVESSNSTFYIIIEVGLDSFIFLKILHKM